MGTVIISIDYQNEKCELYSRILIEYFGVLVFTLTHPWPFWPKKPDSITVFQWVKMARDLATHFNRGRAYFLHIKTNVFSVHKVFLVNGVALYRNPSI